MKSFPIHKFAVGHPIFESFSLKFLSQCNFSALSSLSVQELKIRSSHDILKEDPKLSSQPAVDPAALSLG